MADFNEIKKAFYELVESYADAPESSETKSKIADFAKLLPGDKEEQHNTLKNLDAAVRADVRIPGRINLPAAVKKNIGTLLSGLQKHMTAKQPKPAQNDDKPKKQPEKADNKRPNLSPEEFKEKLNKLYKVFMNSLDGADVGAVDENINKDDKEMRGYVRNLRAIIAEKNDFNLDGIPNGPILKTIRRALENYKKKQNQPDSERKPRPEKKDRKKKGGPDMADEKKITDEMRHKLNELGFSDEVVNGLSYDDAADILKDKDLKKTLDEMSESQQPPKDKPKEDDESKPKDPTAPIGVTEKPGEEREEHTDEKAPWVIRKQKWFDENIQPANKADYKVTRADTEFEVQFAQGSIHYESETNAVVSKDASYKVYEALLKDPDNAQRPVKFPENASEHLTNMLYAASILNETPDGKPHEMQGLDKSKLNMEAIEKALKEAGYGDAEFKKVKAYYDTHEGKPAAENEHSQDDHGVELSEVVKAVKAEDFKRGTATNSMKFSPNGTYNLESGEVRIDAVDKEPKVVYYSGTAPTGLPADVKAEPLKDEEVNHIKEQAKPAMEKEVKRILDDQTHMEELKSGGLFRVVALPNTVPTANPIDPNNEDAKKAADEYNALLKTQPQDNAFVNHVMGSAPDVILKIHGDENTPQSQKDFLQGKADSAKNIKDLLKERATLIDKDEKDLTPKDRVALTKNYIALLEEYKKDPSLVEVAMAEDLKQNNNSAERAKVHEDVKSKDKRSDFEEYHKTMEDYSKQAHDAVAAGGKLTIQDYMKKKYSTLSPEELDKRTKNQIQYNNAYQQYRSQKSTNTH